MRELKDSHSIINASIKMITIVCETKFDVAVMYEIDEDWVKDNADEVIQLLY